MMESFQNTYGNMINRNALLGFELAFLEFKEKLVKSALSESQSESIDLIEEVIGQLVDSVQ